MLEASLIRMGGHIGISFQGFRGRILWQDWYWGKRGEELTKSAAFFAWSGFCGLNCSGISRGGSVGLQRVWYGLKCWGAPALTGSLIEYSLV